MAKILIVDDREGYRRYIERKMRGEGHEAQTASSGKDAITAGGRFDPDVLIVDWQLGDDCSGMDVWTALRALNPKLQVIFITGFSSAELERTMGAERPQILEKPFDLEELAQAVRRVTGETEASSV
jgi:DNA-binding response OmpR family regulator